MFPERAWFAWSAKLEMHLARAPLLAPAPCLPESARPFNSKKQRAPLPVAAGHHRFEALDGTGAGIAAARADIDAGRRGALRLDW